jgi:dipeptidyl aminopeptidase/acylaminoacyl peptidase
MLAPRTMKNLLLAGLAAAALIALPAASDARPMTATDLATMNRLGAPAVSPDGRWIAYQLRETDLAANRGRLDLYLLDTRTAGAAPVRIASTPEHNEHSPAFSADSRHLYYLSNQSGSDQLWRVAVPGGTAEQLTRLAAGISGYSLSPAGNAVAIWGERDLRCRDYDCADLPARAEGQGSARVYDQTFVRHWDRWAEPGVRQRIFTLPLADGVPQGSGRPVLGGLVGDAPSRPFGGGEEIAWSPDGRTLYFTLREAGRIEPISTNLDIFAVPADGSAAPTNLTAANQATDTLPTVSPDGRWLAYVAMARPGYEADRQVVQLRDLRTGAVRALTEGWDRSVSSLAWAADGRSLLATTQDVLDYALYRIDLRTGRPTRLSGPGTIGNVRPLPGGGILFTRNDVTRPDDLYRMDARGRVAQLTDVNAATLAALDPVDVRRFSFVNAAGATVWGQIVKSAQAAEPLPVAFLVHGGPQGSFGNSWSWRWNPRTFVGPGYATVSVDFTGSTGYGQAFTDAINRDWGGAPLDDLRRGLAAAGAADAGIDTANACALGGSYGGYMVNWIAGRWPEGFRCLVNHAGIFDTRALAWETEELWFTEWEFGGPAYDPRAIEAIERWNPVHHVANWRTPMLVIHGERDFRIPYSQALATFNALQRRDIPSRLVMYPDENHWILRPQNSIQWYREVHGWLDQWLRGGSGAERRR